MVGDGDDGGQQPVEAEGQERRGLGDGGPVLDLCTGTGALALALGIPLVPATVVAAGGPAPAASYARTGLLPVRNVRGRFIAA